MVFASARCLNSTLLSHTLGCSQSFQDDRLPRLSWFREMHQVRGRWLFDATFSSSHQRRRLDVSVQNVRRLRKLSVVCGRWTEESGVTLVAADESSNGAIEKLKPSRSGPAEKPGMEPIGRSFPREGIQGCQKTPRDYRPMPVGNLRPNCLFPFAGLANVRHDQVASQRGLKQRCDQRQSRNSPHENRYSFHSILANDQVISGCRPGLGEWCPWSLSSWRKNK